MIVTDEFIVQGISKNGGWNFSQMVLLGATWPPTRGWKQRAIGREISDADAELFLHYAQERPSKMEREAIKRVAQERQNLEKPVPRTYYKTHSFSKDEFLSSYEWRKLRIEAFKRYGLRCQCCGATTADGVRLHVDHIKPRKLYPELALDIDNLQILCEPCNHGKGNWDMTDWRQQKSNA